MIRTTCMISFCALILSSYSFFGQGNGLPPDEEDFLSKVRYIITPEEEKIFLATPDLGKIGIQYYDFSLPDALSFQNKLGLTSIFFIQSLKELPSPETVTQIHRYSFVYSTLEISPKTEAVFLQREALDIMYFIYGCRPDSGTNQYNILINYKAKKGKDSIIKFKGKSFNFHFISHPIPVLNKDNQPPEPGSYVLQISIKDIVSGLSLKEDVAF